MCGIAGVLNHNTEVNAQGLLINMLEAVQHRGPDSCGIAVSYNDPQDEYMFKILLRNDIVDNVVEQINAITNGGHVIHMEECDHLETLLELRCKEGMHQRIAGLIKKYDDISLISHGKFLEIFKEINFDALHRNYSKRNLSCHIGIGHVRLATESKISRASCHPFQCLDNENLAIVHNGQITNYKKLRNMLRVEGFTFFTDNDSEVIVNFISYCLRDHNDFYSALNEVRERLDGTFTVAAMYNGQLGVFNDNICAKPLWICEDKLDNSVYIASENQAFSSQAFNREHINIYELESGSVKVWRQ